MIAALTTLLADVGPAGGAPTEDLVPGTIVAVVGIALFGWMAVRYRRGAAQPLRKTAAWASSISGLPEWAALPTGFAGTSLIIAVFGFYWDVSTHIDNGRDAGPFANPAHFFILAGLVGIAIGGYLAVLLGSKASTPAAVRIADDWNVPVGGVLLLVCGAIALLGFPLDDVWHRLFGQDVTLWGPTHVQMIGGASLATLAVWALLREARVGRPTIGSGKPLLVVRFRDTMLAGAFLLGLSTLQGEFDFGVPQFPLLNHPVLLMVAASIGLVAARIRLGRGGALAAVGFFLFIRVLIAVAVAPLLGRSLLHFPLYLVEALLVEAVALRIPRDRQLQLGAVAGALIGTIGLAAEWAWSHIWMPHPWPASLLPEGVVFGFIAAVAGGVIGGLVGRALAPPDVNRPPLPRWAVAGAAVALLIAIAYPVPKSAGSDVRADVTLREVASGPQRTVEATVRLDPPNAAKDAHWFEALAWQGRDWQRGGLVQSDLEHVGEGVYRTTEPLPVYGNWKAIVRIHRDKALQAMPIYLPEDTAIPAAGVAATQSFSREFVSDKALLQREAKAGNDGLQLAGYLVLLLIALAWIGAMAWGLGRLDAVAARTTPAVTHASLTPA